MTAAGGPDSYRIFFKVDPYRRIRLISATSELKPSERRANTRVTDCDGKKSILIICSGNTCRSPMAKVILEQLLEQAGKAGYYSVDSAAKTGGTAKRAAINARDVIRQMYGEGLLGTHRPKPVAPELVEQADIILVVESWMKGGLPAEKTWGLKEYVDEKGDLADPFGGDIGEYRACARELTTVLSKLVDKLD